MSEDRRRANGYFLQNCFERSPFKKSADETDAPIRF